MSTGAKVGFGCLGCFGLFLFLALLGGCMSLLSGDTADTSAPAASSSPEEPPAEEAAAEEEPEQPAEEPEEEPAVTMTATHGGTTGDTLDDTVYTVVNVEIVNDSEDSIEVNPIYFSAELADGTVVSDWSDAIFADLDNPLDAVTLQPGQKASGQIALVGEVDVAAVTMEELFGLEDPVTATVE
ncbi:DUF4352 domain-containing protein [Nocardiopsis sp. MT53]|uniref:DUF4352 domain-containing protein n=3 Tax=Nocardiopsidaceae TaxID=83676 RepID=A0ABX8BU16_9ACTN|nr:DUF4352 domain-containing protein [Nocardiopsis changdeensis]QYX40204.1 DUF4352 domain-containing protein [Nocardiopsis sp. MT53]